MEYIKFQFLITLKDRFGISKKKLFPKIWGYDAQNPLKVPSHMAMH